MDLGDSATITCNATNVPLEYMTCITQGQENSEEIANCSQVAVQDVSVTDGGYYSCVSTASINETDMASCFLQVISMLWLILVIIFIITLAPLSHTQKLLTAAPHSYPVDVEKKINIYIYI